MIGSEPGLEASGWAKCRTAAVQEQQAERVTADCRRTVAGGQQERGVAAVVGLVEGGALQG